MTATREVDSGADARAREIAAIDALLPQTQCAQCGHPGCLPYAAAIAEGGPIDRCPPGGDATVHALARLLRRNESTIAPDLPRYPGPRVAIIIEERCIGCARCLPACPVDAIVGASKWMHTVIADHCTGCELCIAPCPVDCIEMVPSSTDVREPTQANLSRQRARAHSRRAETRAEEAERRRRERRNTRRQNATP